MELSEVVTQEVKHNQKININPTAGRNFDNKIKNEIIVEIGRKAIKMVHEIKN